MNPHEQFCPNNECPARGQKGKGNIRIHSWKEERYICRECGKTFKVSKGTIYYRLRSQAEKVRWVVILLGYGCPIQAIVKAFEIDERTVRAWWRRAGRHCQRVHEYKVEQATLDLGQVQADEIKVRRQEGYFWMALALMVSTRLWLAGEVSVQRDMDLIQALSDQIKGMALCRPLLLAVDGLASYVSAIRNSFRTTLPNRKGENGRPKLVSWPNICIVQVVKQRIDGQLNISRRIVQGSEQMVHGLIRKTQGSGGINTAFIERLNATFRQRLNCLARRTRTLVRKTQTLEAGMYVVGCLYNFCDPHHSLRLKLSVGRRGFRWVERTPALAAGLADHIWTTTELFDIKVPLPRWKPPVHRGRPSLLTLQLIKRWCL